MPKYQGVYKKGNRYYPVVYIDGKQKWLQGFSTAKQAAEHRAEILKKHREGLPVDVPDITLSRFIQEWLETSNASAKTKIRYEQLLRLHIEPHLGHKKLALITPLEIQKIYAESKIHPRTLLHTHRALRRALQVALRWGYVSRNICDLVDPPKPPKPKNSALTAEEAQKLLATVAKDGDQLNFVLYTTALLTGMREGELLGLRWSDVDLERSVLYVHQSLKRATRKEVVFGPVKSYRSERPIVIGPGLTELLTAWRGERVGCELIFCHHDGRPLDFRRVEEKFKSYLKKAGLSTEHVFHSLRHTHATVANEEGADVKSISDRLGHSGVKITLDTYTHFTLDPQQDVAEKVEGAILKKKGDDIPHQTIEDC